MRYEGQIYRPPGEWRSYLLQCTVGCSHNKCTFCGMYKLKKFHIRPMKEIIEDIAMARAYYVPESVDKVFLCDGDAIVMRQEQLLQILEALYAAFPNLRQVTVYAGTRSTMTKTQEQLIELRQLSLERLLHGSDHDLVQALGLEHLALAVPAQQWRDAVDAHLGALLGHPLNAVKIFSWRHSKMYATSPVRRTSHLVENI